MRSERLSTQSYRILLVAQTAPQGALLASALAELGHSVRQRTHDAWLEAAQQDGELLVIEVERVERRLVAQLEQLQQTRSLPVVLFAREEAPECTDAVIRAGVDAYVVAGFEMERLATILRVAWLRFHERQVLREALARVQGQLASRREIERAKGLLMKHKALDEDTAYRTLRTLAMNKNMKMVEVARSLINAMDVLA